MKEITTVLLSITFAVNAASDSVSPGEYRYYKPPTVTTACVRVEWVKDTEEAMKRCKGGWGCYYAPAGGQPGWIIAPKPKDFNDSTRLLILGHEFLHTLGAEHD